ncbi:MAG: GntR family transcriptional regulator [Rhizobiaceae bacterium]|nr:GntR family transcriptional regulator [Rhizobiaceae bacterium]
MRNETLYKRTYNDLLKHVEKRGVGTKLDSERKLAQTLGASRTTIRKCLAAMQNDGILAFEDGWSCARIPTASDQFEQAETIETALLVEQQFLKWILQTDSRPGQALNASRLAREFHTSTTSIREFLQSFQHFGLLERRQSGSWVFKGMTLEFANELSDIREIFELRSVLKFAQLPQESDSWRQLRDIRDEHVELLASIESNYHSFSHLDEKLHRLINGASSNRFVTEFYQVISLIFFYHYQWNKVDERERNEAAIHQHLTYIDAILSRDEQKITEACNRHLHAARSTLMHSIGNVAMR